MSTNAFKRDLQEIENINPTRSPLPENSDEKTAY